MTGVELTHLSAPGRVRSWTRSALRDLVYAGAVCIWGVFAFSVLVSGISVTAALLPLVVGVFIWVGFVHVLHWTTRVDRSLAGWRRGEPVPATYRSLTGPGLMPLLRTLTTDPQTWRELTWLALTSVVGFAWGLAVLTAAGLVVVYISMPSWYWAVTDPGAEYGITNLGFVTIDTFGEAAAVAALGVALLPIALLLARSCAATHSALAVRVLGASPVATGGHPAGGRDA